MCGYWLCHGLKAVWSCWVHTWHRSRLQFLQCLFVPRQWLWTYRNNYRHRVARIRLRRAQGGRKRFRPFSFWQDRRCRLVYSDHSRLTRSTWSNVRRLGFFWDPCLSMLSQRLRIHRNDGRGWVHPRFSWLHFWPVFVHSDTWLWIRSNLYNRLCWLHSWWLAWAWSWI